MNWLEAGWQVFAAEPAVRAWAEAARAPALAAARSETHAHWRRHRGTWFVGVDVLDNDATGRVGSGPALSGRAVEAAKAATGVARLHRAQVSVTYPGYPARDAEESAAAHRYRRTRDAAHLDGLLPEGPEKRRHLREPHAWILGLPLSDAHPKAAPLVVWEGGHRIIGAAFAEVFAGHDPAGWGDLDVTEAYRAARAQVFETCPRVELPLAVGQSVLLHRQIIHGVAPWDAAAGAAEEGRVIAYFRPCFTNPADWLTKP